MKKAGTLILFMLAALSRPEMAAEAGGKGNPALAGAPVAIACMHLGNLAFLVLAPAPGRPDPRAAQCIMLAGPTRPARELKSYRDGSDVFFGSPADDAAYAKFGRSGYQKMMFMGKPAELNSFQQVGERWASVIDGALYQEVDGVARGIAATEMRSYKGEDGRERRAQMCQRPGLDGNWCFAAENGQVFLQAPSGAISQIGWMEWRVAPLPRGEKALMLMTKGMGKNARWSGKRDGKIFVEK